MTTPNMNAAIQSCLRFRPKEEWITHSSGLPWLRLDLPVSRSIVDEALALSSLSVDHRSQDDVAGYRHQGWKSLTLYGAASNITEQTAQLYSWTWVADRCPATKSFIQDHWIIDENTGRIRFMYLEPGGFIMPHADRQQKKLFECNIALTQPVDCVFRFLDYGNVPFSPLSGYMIDTSHRHLVTNNSNQLRIHMIVHGQLKPGLIKKSYEQSFYC